MLTGYQIPMTLNPQVDMCLPWEEQLSLGNLLRRLALQGPLWSLNSLHWIKQEKKQSGSETSLKIFLCGIN